MCKGGNKASICENQKGIYLVADIIPKVYELVKVTQNAKK